MIRIFLDSSVLYSAAYSAKGHSRDLILLAIQNEISLVLSDLVIQEVRHNLNLNAPETLPVFDFLLSFLPFETVNPSRDEILDAAKIVELKDAPILAAAKKSQVDYLVTLDKKHLLDKPLLSQYSGMPILTSKNAFISIHKPAA